MIAKKRLNYICLSRVFLIPTIAFVLIMMIPGALQNQTLGNVYANFMYRKKSDKLILAIKKKRENSYGSGVSFFFSILIIFELLMRYCLLI
jgi:hypothetical protein